MKSPLIILIELLAGVISNTFSTIIFIFKKLGELMVSLFYVSSLGIFGIILAVVIGGVVFYFFSRVIFKTSKSLLPLALAFIAIILVLVLLSLIFQV